MAAKQRTGDRDEKLADRDEKLALLIAGGASRQRAASESGYSVRTVYNRCQDRAFLGRVAELREEMVAETLGMLSSSGVEAVARLRVLMRSDTEHIALQASQAILGHMRSLREHSELKAEVEGLRAMLANVEAERSQSWG